MNEPELKVDGITPDTPVTLPEEGITPDTPVTLPEDGVIDPIVPETPPVVEMRTTMKLLVRRDKTTGEVLTQQMLFDDNDTQHVIIDSLPVIEDKPGFEGYYIIGADMTVTVGYREIPKTPEEQQNEINAALMLEIAMLKAQVAGGTPPTTPV